jgi:thioredoxin-related protein
MRVRFLAVLLLTGGAVRAADPGSIRWIKNLKQASEVAQEANRPMLIDFWADWCAPCKVMDAKVYTNSALAEAVGRTIVPVRINLDMQPEVARRYNVQTIPQVVFTDSYGTELMRRRGYVDVQGLSAALNTLPVDLSELNRVDRVLQASKNDFESLLEMGGRLKAAGFFDSSSVYYERALKQDEARKNSAKREFILEQMGLDYLELKDSKRAVQIFERCLKEFPSSERRPDAMLNLARAYLLGE